MHSQPLPFHPDNEIDQFGPHLRACFAEIDTDNSGSLSVDELRHWIQAQRDRFWPQQLTQIDKHLDEMRGESQMDPAGLKGLLQNLVIMDFDTYRAPETSRQYFVNKHTKEAVWQLPSIEDWLDPERLTL